MTEEYSENKISVEEYIRKIKTLIAEGKNEEAKKIFDAYINPMREMIDDTERSALDEISGELNKSSKNNEEKENNQELQSISLKAKDIIDQGYSTERMQELNEMFTKIKEQSERDNLFNILRENPNIETFVVGMAMQKSEQQLSDYMLSSISLPYNHDIHIAEKGAIVRQLDVARDYMYEKGVIPEMQTQQKPEKINQTQTSQPRPQTAEIGEKPKKSGFLSRIKDKIEQVKLDYHYSGLTGVLGHRGKEGNGTFLHQGFNEITKDFSHIKKLDFNRYPNMTTFMQDLTVVDHVILPDPEKHKNLNLSASKLKGKLNLSAYDRVELMQADLSKVTELDLSGCKDIDLSGVDLSHVKLKLPNPMTGEINLRDTKLPPMENLDLSQAKCILDNTDFSRVDTVVMPKEVLGEDISGWPRHIDASQCDQFIARGCNMANVEEITPPKTSYNGPTATIFELNNCQITKVEKLDVATCGKVIIVNNDMPSLNQMKIQGRPRHEEMLYGNQVPQLKTVEINRSYMPRNDDKTNMFQTYKNIFNAVEHGRTAYKDAETEKMCPLTQNQKKAIDVIKSSSRFYGDGLEGFWSTMSVWCNDPKTFSATTNLCSSSKQKQVMTEYNRALSQALGLKSYINMETMKYETTPPMKEGEKLEIPPFNSKEFNKLSYIKNTNSVDKWGKPMMTEQLQMFRKTNGR